MILRTILLFFLSTNGYRSKSNRIGYDKSSSLRLFNLIDYTHYLDYLPYRVEGINGFEDFRTAPYPPSQLRNRKMYSGTNKLNVETVLANPTWPINWY